MNGGVFTLMTWGKFGEQLTGNFTHNYARITPTHNINNLLTFNISSFCDAIQNITIPFSTNIEMINLYLGTQVLMNISQKYIFLQNLIKYDNHNYLEQYFLQFSDFNLRELPLVALPFTKLTIEIKYTEKINVDEKNNIVFSCRYYEDKQRIKIGQNTYKLQILQPQYFSEYVSSSDDSHEFIHKIKFDEIFCETLFLFSCVKILNIEHCEYSIIFQNNDDDNIDFDYIYKIIIKKNINQITIQFDKSKKISETNKNNIDIIYNKKVGLHIDEGCGRIC